MNSLLLFIIASDARGQGPNKCDTQKELQRCTNKNRMIFGDESLL